MGKKKLSEDGLDDLIEANPSEFEAKAEDEVVDDKEANEAYPDDQESDEQADESQDEVEETSEETVESEAETAEEKAVQKLKFRGKEYTPEQFLADEKLRNDLNTAANQQTHFQKLYEEERKERERERKLLMEQLQQIQARGGQPQQPQEPPNPQHQITPEQLKLAYKPAIEALQSEGWIEEDMAELYPNAVTGMVSIRDEFATRIAMLEQAVSQFIAYQQTQQSTSQRQGVIGKIDSIFDQLAAKGGIFSDLADHEVRERFLTTIRDQLNPEISTLISDPSVLESLWIGHNHDRLVAQIQQERDRAAASSAQSRRTVVGEGGGRRATAPQSAPPQPGEMEGWADL